MIKGIDVSRWQGLINWNKVKASGVDFVLLKAGGSDSGFYTDSKYYTNYHAATEAGLHVGAYYFVGPKCNSNSAGLADAYRFLKIIEQTRLDYPVYIDFEAPTAKTKQGNTDACIAFCQFMENQGYYAGIYASDISGFKDRLFLGQLKAFDKWVARYGSEPKYVKPWGIWQSTSKGIVSGITGNVDLDYSKNDYSSIIRNNHLNGF